MPRSGGPEPPLPNGRTAPGARRRLVAVGVLVVLLAGTALTYRSLLAVQQELFENGLPSPDPTGYPRPGVDLTAAQASLDRYWPLVAGVVALYLAVLVTVRFGTRLVGLLAACAAAVGQLVLLPTRPGLSIDLYSYVAHGYLANQPFSSPYQVAAAQVAGAPIGPVLLDLGWMPVHPETPYGPFWTHLESLSVAVSADDVGRAALLLKVVVTAASIGTGVLAFFIAEQVRAGLGPLAATAWLLNPVAVVEFAVEGHNDAVPVFLTACALLAALRGWAVTAVVTLALASLTKYTPAALGLAVLVMLLRSGRPVRRTWLGVGVGLLASVGLAWLLWQRWWTGWDTLAGLRASTTVAPTDSPAGWLTAPWSDPYADPYAVQSSLVPQLVLAGVVLLVVLAASWGRTAGAWLAGCAAIALAVLAVSPTYWPWYAALPIAVLAVRPAWVSLVQVTALTVGSRIAAPWGDLAALGLVPYQDANRIGTLAGLTVPLGVCVLAAAVALPVHLWRGRRRSSSAERSLA